MSRYFLPVFVALLTALVTACGATAPQVETTPGAAEESAAEREAAAPAAESSAELDRFKQEALETYADLLLHDMDE